MSFILEALKKSEQQRRQGNDQQVRKRTLSLASQKPGRQRYWLLAGLAVLAMLVLWWFLGSFAARTGQPLVENLVPQASPSSQPLPRKAEAAKPVQKVSAQKPAAPVQTTAEIRDIPSAPVPDYSYGTADQKPRKGATESLSGEDMSKQAPTILVDRVEPQAAAPVALPRYLDLSRALRERMPRLAMSMHFYMDSPGRRLVRINDRLLHEGDWLNDDLQVIAITPAGATLDYLGKVFEMRNPKR